MRSAVPRIFATVRPQSRPKSRYAALAVVAAAALMQSGCEAFLGTLFSGRIRECDGFDVPLGSLASSSRKELRVRVMGPRVQYDIPFVVESSADSFVLIGFTPLGTKAFSLDRKGDEVKVEKLMGPAQPVPPENLMADVLAMSIPSTCAQYADGVVTNDIGNWRLSDNCKDSRPLDRTITRLLPKASDKPEVVVEYQGDAIVVRQKQCNYIGRYMLQAVVVPGPPQPYVPTPVKPPTQSAAPKTPPAAAKPAAPAPTSAPATAPATPAAPGVAPAPATKPAEPAKDAKPAAPAAPSQPPAPATAPAQPQAAQPAPAPDAAPQVIIRHVPRERPSLRGMFKKKGAPTTTLPPQP